MAHHEFVPDHYHNTLGWHEPVLEVAPGDSVSTTTVDARGRERDGQQAAVGQPQTGPFYVTGAEFLQLLAELRGENKAIWMTTHDIFRAKQIADRVGIMVEGDLVKIFTREELGQEDLESIYVEFVSQPAEQAA